MEGASADEMKRDLRAEPKGLLETPSDCGAMGLSVGSV
jgi:hypothetical protein